MRIEQLEQVLAVAKEGSFCKAAESLFISQPNLSQSVQSLEKEIGAPLFIRSRRGATPTEYGREFIDLARSAYVHFDALREFFPSGGAPQRKCTQRLQIACQYLSIPGETFTDMAEKHSAETINFSYLNMNFLEIIKSVGSHEADVGIVALLKPEKNLLLRLMESQGIAYEPLCSASPCVVTGMKNPLFYEELENVTREQIARYPLVSYPESFFSFGIDGGITNYFKTASRITVSDWSMIFDIVRRTDAIAIAIRLKGIRSGNPAFRVLPIRECTDWLELGYVYSTNSPLSDIASEFVRGIRVRFSAHDG